jgi:hypothetical protein
MTSVGTSLTIQDNDALTDLDDIDAIDSVGTDLFIRLNDALCQTIVDAYASRLESLGWIGELTDDGNADC